MKIFLFCLLAILLVYLIKSAYRNTKDVALKKIKIDEERTGGDGTKITILHLSDLHLEKISISPNELYEMLKDEAIDLIALTGDFLDHKRTIPKLVPYLKVLNQLHATYGIYAVLGNHDYMLRPRNVQTLIDTLEQNNCKVLINENDVINVQGNLVNIIGIDDFSTKRSKLEASYKGIQPGTNLVLTHDPNIILTMQNYQFDYLLAGHFHGGQIRYPKAYHLVKMGELPRMNIIKGLHRQNGKLFYISEGLGQTGINIRIGSRPEVTLHELSLAVADHESLTAG